MYLLPGALVVVGAGVVVGATYGGALMDKEILFREYGIVFKASVRLTLWEGFLYNLYSSTFNG